MARRQPILTPGKAALLMLGIGTISLMGIPGFGTDVPPAGALAGVVLDADGETLEGVEVSLFDGATLDLLELAISDELGRFAFQQAPWHHHVLANPDVATGLVPRWELDRERSDPGVLELGLSDGFTTTFQITDDAGAPLAQAEVRVIDAFDDVVVVRALTDEAGSVEVVVPDDFHLGILAASDELAPAWRVDLEAGDEVIAVALEPGTWHTGSLHTTDGEPLAGVVVSAWDARDGEWHWLGYDLSRDDGSFQLLGTETMHLRALDPEQAVLPGAWDVDSMDGELDLMLEYGEPLLVQCGDGQPGRVWIYDEARGLWSWGSSTDAGGQLAVQTAGNETTVHAELDADGTALVHTGVPEPGVPLVLE